MSDASVEKPDGGSSCERMIRVAIIEDVRSLREGFWILIDGTLGFHCTASFRTMEEPLEKIGFDLPEALKLLVEAHNYKTAPRSSASPSTQSAST